MACAHATSSMVAADGLSSLLPAGTASVNGARQVVACTIDAVGEVPTARWDAVRLASEYGGDL